MKTVVAVAVFISLNMGPASAQPAEASQAPDSSHLSDKKWALQFSLDATSNGLLPRIGPFQGSLFSLKYHFSPERAVRVGVRANANLSESDYDRFGFSPDASSSSTGVDFELISQYIFYAIRYSEVYFYAGAGPTFQFSYTKSVQTDATSTTTTYKSSLYGIGLSGVLGAEYFVLSWLSLSGEYRGNAKYTSSWNSSPSQKITASTFRAGGDGVQLGTTIYF